MGFFKGAAKKVRGTLAVLAKLILMAVGRTLRWGADVFRIRDFDRVRPFGSSGRFWHYLREGFYCVDPLRDSYPPKIDVLLVVGEKDYGNLEQLIKAARTNISNPISRVYIVHQESLPDMKIEEGVVLIDERSVLSPQEKMAIDVFPKHRRGWVTQQLLKLAVATDICENSVLVIDGDTFLTGQRLWLNSEGVQILTHSPEHHVPYLDHVSSFLKMDSIRDISYVCHHQLWQRDILKSLFPRREDLLAWLQSSQSNHESSVSEYQTYGTYITTLHANRCLPAAWSNESMKKSESPPRGMARKLVRGSISRHSYLG